MIKINEKLQEYAKLHDNCATISKDTAPMLFSYDENTGEYYQITDFACIFDNNFDLIVETSLSDAHKIYAKIWTYLDKRKNLCNQGIEIWQKELATIDNLMDVVRSVDDEPVFVDDSSPFGLCTIYVQEFIEIVAQKLFADGVYVEQLARINNVGYGKHKSAMRHCNDYEVYLWFSKCDDEKSPICVQYSLGADPRKFFLACITKKLYKKVMRGDKE